MLSNFEVYLNFVYHSFSVVQITFLGYLVKATFSNPDTYCVHVSFISNLLLSLPVVAAVGFQIRVESWKLTMHACMPACPMEWHLRPPHSSPPPKIEVKVEKLKIQLLKIKIMLLKLGLCHSKTPKTANSGITESFRCLRLDGNQAD